LLGLVPMLISYGFYLIAWRQAQPTPLPTVLPAVLPARSPASAPDVKPAPAPDPGPPPRVLSGLLLVPAARSRDAENLVAAVEAGSGQERWLGAFDGATGEVLWRWPLDPSQPGLADALRSVIDGVLLVASPSTVYALSPDTGELSWSRDTGGRALGLCRGDGFAGLSFPNQRFVAFSVATGSSVDGRPDACAEALTSKSIAPNFSVVEGGALEPRLPRRAPLDVQRALVPHKGTARVLLGTDASGAARVAVASRERWLWDAGLGRGRAQRARLLSPPLAAVRNERVVVPYILADPGELRLASLELASGRLIWDEALELGLTSGEATRDVEARAPNAELRLSRAGTIYFSNGKGQLWVVGFDAQPAWKLGER
jgi:outer membrane protein assembly factor BamB